MESVPKITIDGNRARSNAALPRAVPDTCACWSGREKAKGRKLLRTKDEVICEDATAYAALVSLGLDIVRKGGTAKAKIKKGWG
jgi:hypothetical protein